MGFGDYPAEYNPKVHGPYDPARWYGKPDTPLTQTKLGDLAAWFGRRQKSPQAITASVSRGYWRWLHKYVHPKKAGLAPYLQIVFVTSAFFYLNNYPKIRAHRQQKYHW